MAEAGTDRREHVGKTSVSLFGAVSTWLLRLVFLLAVALLLSILIEWVGMLFFWPEQGVDHSRAMVEQELVYLGTMASSNNLVASWVDGLLLLVIDWVERAVTWTRVERLATTSIEVVRLGAVSAINMVYVFALRVLVLVLSMPTFLIFGIAGFTRGVMQRELRRWGGGRESSGMFHLYRTLMPASFIGVWFLYLSMPFSINPFWLVGPAALLFALLVMGASYRFKKYV